MQKRTRYILIICILVFTTFLFGCSVKPLDNSNDSILTTQTEEKQTAATQAQVDMNGYKWTISMPWASKYIPDKNGSEQDDRLINIYEKLEEAYNITFNVKTTLGVVDYTIAAASDLNYADVIGIRSYEIVALAVNDYIYSVEDPVLISAGMNFEDNSRWYTGISEYVKWQGRQWTVQMNSLYDIPDFGSFILYNRQMLSDYGYKEIEKMVYNGSWTNEKYFEMVQSVIKDLDGDGVYDIYGTAICDKMIPVCANGGQIIEETDGIWTNGLNNADTVKAITVLGELLDAENGFCQSSPGKSVNMFCSGKLAFLWGSSLMLLDSPELSESEYDYGILPIPNATGDAYKNPVCSYNGYGLMTTNKNLSDSVMVFNAFASEISVD